MGNVQMTLKAARVNAGLTQQQVLAQTGFARSTLTRWEHGDTVPREKDLQMLCALYGVRKDQIKLKQKSRMREHPAQSVELI